jgi:DnaK suppressor protein
MTNAAELSTNDAVLEPGEVTQLLDAEEIRLRQLIGTLEGGGLIEHTGTDEHLAPTEDRTMDGGAELAERTLELGLLDSIEEKLGELSAARERLEAGTYGCCEHCGKMIAPERLRTLPLVRECASHPAT